MLLKVGFENATHPNLSTKDLSGNTSELTVTFYIFVPLCFLQMKEHDQVFILSEQLENMFVDMKIRSKYFRVSSGRRTPSHFYFTWMFWKPCKLTEVLRLSSHWHSTCPCFLEIK